MTPEDGAIRSSFKLVDLLLLMHPPDRISFQHISCACRLIIEHQGQASAFILSVQRLDESELYGTRIDWTPGLALRTANFLEALKLSYIQEKQTAEHLANSNLPEMRQIFQHLALFMIAKLDSI
jgi:hypothetical protein